FAAFLAEREATRTVSRQAGVMDLRKLAHESSRIALQRLGPVICRVVVEVNGIQPLGFRKNEAQSGPVQTVRKIHIYLAPTVVFLVPATDLLDVASLDAKCVTRGVVPVRRRCTSLARLRSPSF